MAKNIQAEAQTSSDTEKKKRRRKQKGKQKAKESNPTSENDTEYIGSSSEGSSLSDEGDESDEVEILNKEVIWNLFPL